jgi:hypothetical protein
MKTTIKQTLLLAGLLCVALSSSAQMGGLLNKAKDKVKDKAASTPSSSSGSGNKVTTGSSSHSTTTTSTSDQSDGPHSPTQLETEEYLKGILGANGFYSASLLQGINIELYKPAFPELQSLPVFCLGLDDKDPNQSTIEIMNVAMRPGQITHWSTLKMPVENLLNSGVTRVMSQPGGITKDDFTITPWKNGLVGFQLLNNNSEARFIYVPFKKDMFKKDVRQLFLAAEKELDETKITYDMFAADRAIAKAANMGPQKTEMLAKLKARAKEIGSKWEAERLEDVKKEKFPPPGALKDPALEKEILALVNKYAKTDLDFDPANLKKLIIADDDWSVRSNEYGQILGQTLGVTVGFSKDGHCYHTSFQVQKDYTGDGSFQKSVHLNGFTSRWNEMLCENIK